MPELWQMSVHFLDHDAILEERVRGHGLVGVSLFLFPTFTNTVAARVIKPSHPSYPASVLASLARTSMCDFAVEERPIMRE